MMINNKLILQKILILSKELKKSINIMEVCGTHTQVVSRFGVREALPANINLTTGPGCPVCVTTQKDIDSIVYLANSGVPIAVYGDLLRVRGQFGSLEDARQNGAKIFVVYSVEEALFLCKKFKDLVFFGLGFETTIPMTAYAIKKGLIVYSAHKLFLPAMEALLQIKELNIDGFLCPGHVSAIIGTEPYKIMKIPQVITGFELSDVLLGIFMLLKQINNSEAKVENEYVRVVKNEGNKRAQEIIFEVFETSNGYWRGFGEISGSGLKIKRKFQNQDAFIKYKKLLSTIDYSKSIEPTGCRCSEIIRGLALPKDCLMFKNRCTPENPVGPCMVSVEGACNVYKRNYE